MNTGVNRVFGTSLHQLSIRMKSRRTIPPIIFQTINYLDMNGLDQEGIFRLNGRIYTIENYRDLFDIGEVPSFQTECDPHTVAGLLKLYLREMPEPILTFKFYDSFIKLEEDDPPNKIRLVLNLIKKLPEVNFTVIKFLLGFLRRVSQMSDINKMTKANLATVFGPNLLRQETSNLGTIMQHTPLVNSMTELLIENYQDILELQRSSTPKVPRRSYRNLPPTPGKKRTLPATPHRGSTPILPATSRNTQSISSSAPSKMKKKQLSDKVADLESMLDFERLRREELEKLVYELMQRVQILEEK
eukprot:TRINITY_DN7363_c0_g1_i1.p1 TRINITY_DN7363_c0_g1~~TRINITY_DN7363_c0_g1_i1.p1  ORF type:complete len:302 (-),score=57.99 TRINITY_DN7363_c0_g1_i1:175-1080(-)